MVGEQDPPELRGIIPNSFAHIFGRVAAEGSSKKFLVRASYLEIYNEEIRDLLSKDPKNRLDLKVSVMGISFFLTRAKTGVSCCWSRLLVFGF